MAQATDEVATKLAKLKEDSRSNGRRVPNGATAKIIAETKEKYGFDANNVISIKTI